MTDVSYRCLDSSAYLRLGTFRNQSMAHRYRAREKCLLRVQPLMSSAVDTSGERQYIGEKAISEVLIEFWPSFC